MSNISKNQIDELQGVMEAMNPALKVNYLDMDGDGDTGDEALADTIVDIDNAVIGLHLQKVTDLNAALDRIQADA